MLRAVIVTLFLAPAALANAVFKNEKVTFNVISSRSIEEPPTIEVAFNNGIKDHMNLEHVKMNDVSPIGCNYIGRMKNDASSSVAVTGCLNKPGDKMEVTLLSKNARNKMFMVDFEGNAEPLENPFEQGGICIFCYCHNLKIFN